MPLPFLAAILTVVCVSWLNRARGVSLSVNIAAAMLVWLGFYAAGIEPALAGLPLALAVPLRARDGVAARSALERTEEWFRPRVAFLIVPAFAFLNAGIRIDPTALGALLQPSSLGILGGLMVGKPLGIFGAIALVGALGLARLPTGLAPWHIFGISMIAGAGFTMSFFLVTLSFESAAMAESARLAVLLGSTLSGLAGLLFLWISTAPRTETK